jgi:hypothetical protein
MENRTTKELSEVERDLKILYFLLDTKIQNEDFFNLGEIMQQIVYTERLKKILLKNLKSIEG